MSIRRVAAVAATVALLAPFPLSAQTGSLTLAQALQKALTANARLAVTEREVGMAEGRRQQAGAYPNPHASFEVDNAFVSGKYAETTLQLSQIIELGAKRDARVTAALAGADAARHQQDAARLELLSDVAMAFVAVLAAQQRIQLLDRQIAALERLMPLMQRRVEAGASSPADVSRTQAAVGLVRVERERARTAAAAARRDLTAQMGATVPEFATVSGQFNRTGRPPAFNTIQQAVESNPQLLRWTAIRAQRDAELLSARLKPVPDVQASLGWRHYTETGDNGIRAGVSIPIAVVDRNRGAIREAYEAAAKAEAERAVNKLTLIAVVGRAYETINGALQEIDLLRRSVLPAARKAFEAVESGYGQGRFTLLELLDTYRLIADGELREQEALQSFHTAVATIEGLTGAPLVLTGERP